MPLTLYVDTGSWRSHLEAVHATHPNLVPVVKGNGYGFGNTRLAAESAKLGVDMVAVGTSSEAPAVAAAFGGDVLVLTPYCAGEESVELPERVVRTVASVAGVRALSGRRVVVDCLTSLRRHGVTETDLVKLRAVLDQVRLEGFALHLPLDRPGGVNPAREVSEWVVRLRAARIPAHTLFVSHLTVEEVSTLADRYPDVRLRPRIGTALWLGDRSAHRAKGTVLDVVPLERGQRFGYRQRKATSDGYLIVVSGGTAQGVGLEAPKSVRGVVPRAKGAAIAGLATVNRTLSPFWWGGKQRWFAEPPHMQVSLLFLPAGFAPPKAGDELEVQVRMTTTHFDRVVDQ